MKKRAIICVHGLWMKRQVFWYVRHALRDLEAEVKLFEYSSIRQPLETSVRALTSYVQSTEAAKIDFIAHSLGGLLLFHYFAKTRDVRLDRVVLMGTPLQGSAIARMCEQSPAFKPLLGKNHAVLQQGIAQWSAPGETIMIAGTRRVGVGTLLFKSSFAQPSDGTVAVEETRDSRLSAHYEIPASHASMLFSKDAVQIIRTFLR